MRYTRLLYLEALFFFGGAWYHETQGQQRKHKNGQDQYCHWGALHELAYWRSEWGWACCDQAISLDRYRELYGTK